MADLQQADPRQPSYHFQEVKCVMPDPQRAFEEAKDAALTLAELHLSSGQHAEAQQILAELADEEPAESTVSTSDTPSIIRHVTLLSKLGQKVGCLVSLYTSKLLEPGTAIARHLCCL